MISKVDKRTALGLICQPDTPLEEILFVVESTNDIVSKILTMLEEWKFCGVSMNVDLLKLMELSKKAKK